jgi:hypothetical protein
MTSNAIDNTAGIIAATKRLAEANPQNDVWGLLCANAKTLANTPPVGKGVTLEKAAKGIPMLAGVPEMCGVELVLDELERCKGIKSKEIGKLTAIAKVERLFEK